MSNDSEKANEKTTRKKNKKVKKNKALKITLITLSILVLFISGLLAYGYFYTTNLLDQVDRVELNHEDLEIDKEVEEKLLKFEDIQNIALFGIDAADGEVGRSDSIMILTIDRTRKKLKLSSIMRDSYVTIPGRKNKDKINHAYAFGGPELALKTLNSNYGLNIKDFVSVDFTNLPKIIDALGGVDIDINAEELTVKPGLNDHIRHINEVNKTDSPYIKITGPQHVDGTQALAYTRIRYTSGGDAERTHRQRVVLSQLFDKFNEMSPLQYPSMISKFTPLVVTSLRSEEILSLAKEIVLMGKVDLEQEKFPLDTDCEDAMIDNVYYLKFNEEETERKMHDYIFEDVAPETNILKDSETNTTNNSSTTKDSN